MNEKRTKKLEHSIDATNPLTRKISLAICTAIGLLVASGTTAKEMTHADIVSQCTATINNYAHFRDQLDAQSYANLFTVDGVFVFPGLVLTGREAIAKRIQENDGSTMSRHLTASISISVDETLANKSARNKNTIQADSYVYVFQAEKSSSPGPVPASKYIVAEYHDLMRMTPSGCKFARREAKIIFTSDIK